MSEPTSQPPHRALTEHALGTRRVLTMVRWLLYLVFVVIAYHILRRLAPVLTPILVAGGIAYLLDPLVDRLVSSGVKRVWAVSLLLVAFLGSIAVAVVLLAPTITKDVAIFIQELPFLVENAANRIAVHLGYEVPASWQSYLESEEVTAFLQQIAGPASTVALAALGSFFGLLAFLAEFLLIPVFAFYFLLDWDPIVQRTRTIIPPRYRADVVDIVIEIDRVVSSWIRGQLTVVSILAVLYAACFSVLDVPMGITIGVLVGLLTIIPFVGTFVGAGITAALLLLDWQGPAQIAWVGLVFVGLHLLEAAVLTPKIVGKKVGLGEAGALFAVVAGGQLLGFTGVLLAVPLAASVAVLLRRVLHYYEQSAFFGAGDHDGSVEPDHDQVLAQIAREHPALRIILPKAVRDAQTREESGEAAGLDVPAEDTEESRQPLENRAPSGKDRVESEQAPAPSSRTEVSESEQAPATSTETETVESEET